MLQRILAIGLLLTTEVWLVVSPGFESIVAGIGALGAVVVVERRIGGLVKGPVVKADLKNVVADQGVSSRLIAGKLIPSFYDCVRASRACNILPSEKHRVQVDGFKYNHFVGPSVVVSVVLAGTDKRTHLFYARTSQAGEPANIFTQGSSILFHASYKYGLTRDRGPVDDWMTSAAKDPDGAVADLLRVPGGTLARVLDYKLALPYVSAECRPFGVVTRDLRKSDKRVFTQYVFEIVYSLAGSVNEADWQELLNGFHVTPESAVRRLEDSVRPEDFLTALGGAKVMDYMVLRALLGDEEEIVTEGGCFKRGFAPVSAFAA